VEHQREEVMRNNLVLAAAVMGIAASLSTVGCSKKNREEEKPAPPPFQRNEGSLAGMVKQERTKIQNDFTNLAYYYLTYESENGKPPSKWEEFKPYIVRDGPASLVSGIEEGRYVVLWKTKPSSNKVLAYEKQPDVNGKQVVVYGDKHIVTISSEELKKALEEKN
jgi:hypothetical protein